MRALNFLFAVIIILFSILFIVLSNNAVLAADDYYFLGLVNEYGIWKGMEHQYFDFSGRWACHLFALLLLKIIQLSEFITLFFISTSVLMFFTLRRLIKKITDFYHLRREKYNSLVLPAFLLASFFFSSSDTGETWFWLISVCSYLYSIIAMTFITGTIISKKNSIGTIIISVGCALYIGGSSESFALSSIPILLLTWFIFRRDRNEKNNFSQNTFVIMIVMIIFLSLAVSILSPGTAKRLGMMPDLEFTSRIEGLITAYAKVILSFITGKILLVIICSIPWYFAGRNYSPPLSVIDHDRCIRKISFAFLILAAILLLPTVMVLSDAGPERTLSVISLVTSIYFAVIFFLLGSKYRLHNTSIVTRCILILCLLAGTLYIAVQVKNQYLITGEFAIAHRSRTEKLLELKEKNFAGIAVLKELPQHGMIYHHEISTDTAYFVNQHLTYGLSTGFPLRIDHSYKR